MKQGFRDLLLLTVSSFLTALAVRCYFGSHNLTPGGITGMAIALSALTGWSISSISLFVSLPLLALSSVVLGKSFGVKTLYVTFVTPVFLSLIPSMSWTNSTLIAAVLGGILIGVAIAIAIYCSCATGGTDVIAMLIHKAYHKLSVAKILFILDIVIVLCSWLITKEFLQSIYSAISLLVIMQTIQFVNKRLEQI